MRRKKTTSIVLILGVLGLISTTAICATMILTKTSGFQIDYSVDGTAHVDGKVYHRMGDNSQYVHLPQYPLHPWWKFNAADQVLQSLNTPTKFLGMYFYPSTPIGVSADFEVKIGHWDYEFTEEDLHYRNSVLDCRVKFP